MNYSSLVNNREYYSVLFKLQLTVLYMLVPVCKNKNMGSVLYLSLYSTEIKQQSSAGKKMMKRTGARRYEERNKILISGHEETSEYPKEKSCFQELSF